jgi:hypothetical protein
MKRPKEPSAPAGAPPLPLRSQLRVSQRKTELLRCSADRTRKTEGVPV